MSVAASPSPIRTSRRRRWPTSWRRSRRPSRRPTCRAWRSGRSPDVRWWPVALRSWCRCRRGGTACCSSMTASMARCPTPACPASASPSGCCGRARRRWCPSPSSAPPATARTAWKAPSCCRGCRGGRLDRGRPARRLWRLPADGLQRVRPGRHGGGRRPAAARNPRLSGRRPGGLIATVTFGDSPIWSLCRARGVCRPAPRPAAASPPPDPRSI